MKDLMNRVKVAIDDSETASLKITRGDLRRLRDECLRVKAEVAFLTATNVAFMAAVIVLVIWGPK